VGFTFKPPVSIVIPIIIVIWSVVNALIGWRRIILSDLNGISWRRVLWGYLDLVDVRWFLQLSLLAHLEFVHVSAVASVFLLLTNPLLLGSCFLLI
jgi:hypothetical protein